jgi:hypothetical protein
VESRDDGDLSLCGGGRPRASTEPLNDLVIPGAAGAFSNGLVEARMETYGSRKLVVRFRAIRGGCVRCWSTTIDDWARLISAARTQWWIGLVRANQTMR